MDKAQLFDYYINENHSRAETADHFQITENTLKKFLRTYGIKKPKSLSLKNRPARSNISEDDIRHYYIEENHTREECLEHFNIGLTAFKRHLKEYGIVKPRSLVRANVEKSLGVSSPFAIPKVREKIRSSNRAKHGYEFPFESPVIQDKAKASMEARYGKSNPNQVPEIHQKVISTCMERYGVENPGGLDWVQEKAKNTMLDRYGTTSGFSRVNSKGSKPNEAFAAMLDRDGITYEREFTLGPYRYDFKVGQNLIEVNPAATHNSTYNPFGPPVDRSYHLKKSQNASDNGYRCIHVWDWDCTAAIVRLLMPRPVLQARKCKVKRISSKVAREFIDRYHIQGYAKAPIRYGLYYEKALVSVMTFGKPRYNDKFEYELVRYCSSSNVTGGAQKLFAAFKQDFNPRSVCSYCDMSKFSGKTYGQLGFRLGQILKPAVHWYNPRTRQHITDNLLRQRGFDQLFGTSFGKGTSNRELMREAGFVEVYDCGQARYEYIFMISNISC